MCNYPWTNRDVYDFHPTTCNINQQVFIGFNVFIMLMGLTNFIFGIYETKIRKRKDLPISSTILGFLFLITYGICLGLNVTFANKLLGLNILHALGRTCFWINLNLYTFRSIEVVIANDTLTMAKSSELRGSQKNLNYIVSFCNLPVELIGLIVPTVVPSQLYTQVKVLVGLGISLTVLNTIPHFYFMRRLRNIIASIPVSREFYDPLQKKIEGLFFSGLAGTIVTSVMALFWVTIPAIYTRLYIIYSIQMTVGLVNSLQNLMVTREGTSTSRSGTGENKKTASNNKTSSNGGNSSHNSHNTDHNTDSHRQPSMHNLHAQENKPLTHDITISVESVGSTRSDSNLHLIQKPPSPNSGFMSEESQHGSGVPGMTGVEEVLRDSTKIELSPIKGSGSVEDVIHSTSTPSLTPALTPPMTPMRESSRSREDVPIFNPFTESPDSPI